jgi:glucose/arabinose dehydrogenase
VASPQAVGQEDRVYCLDSGGSVVWESADPSPDADNVISLALGTNGLLYVTAWDGHSYFRLDKTDGTLVDETGTVDFPVDLAFGPDGYLYVVHGDGPEANRGVHRYDAETGARIDHFVQWQPQGAMRGLAFGPDGDLYVAGGDKVGRYDGATGAHIDWFATGTTLDRLLWHEGYLYVSEKGPNSRGWSDLDGSVLRFDSAGTPVGEFVTAGAGGLKSPEALAFTPAGDLLVCDYYPDSKIRCYEGGTGAYRGNFPTSDGWPRGMVLEALPPAGTLIRLR